MSSSLDAEWAKSWLHDHNFLKSSWIWHISFAWSESSQILQQTQHELRDVFLSWKHYMLFVLHKLSSTCKFFEAWVKQMLCLRYLPGTHLFSMYLWPFEFAVPFHCHQLFTHTHWDNHRNGYFFLLKQMELVRIVLSGYSISDTEHLWGKLCPSNRDLPSCAKQLHCATGDGTFLSSMSLVPSGIRRPRYELATLCKCLRNLIVKLPMIVVRSWVQFESSASYCY